MPFLQYKCSKCGKEFEELVKDSATEVKCPVCHEKAERSFSGKMFSSTGTTSKKCSGNCKTCSGCK